MTRQFNNYDNNSKGLNIEGYAVYDTQLSCDIFEENFKRVDEASYGSPTKTYWIYTDCGQIKGDFEYYIEGTKKQLKAFLMDAKHYDIPYLKELSKDELLADVTEVLEQNYYRIAEKDKIKEAVEEYGIKYLCDFEVFETRRYAQGDSEQIIVDMKALKELWGREPSNEDLQHDFDHYFWDCPVTASVSIDDEEYYYSWFNNDDYEWNPELFIEGILRSYSKERQETIKNELENVLPTELEYN